MLKLGFAVAQFMPRPASESSFLELKFSTKFHETRKQNAVVELIYASDRHGKWIVKL